jgi:glutamyl-tRNA reductase
MSHKTADVALREKLAFDPSQVQRALAALVRRWKTCEFLILSTCNRTELYAARPVHDHPREEEIRHWLGEFHGLVRNEFEGSLYALADADAVGHLFAVVAGMDSLVPGEEQIAAQFKEAYGQAVAAGAAGTVMNELAQAAAHAAKNIRTETGINEGKVSVASVAVDCIAQAFASLADKCVLNIGAGKMNELMLRHLLDLRPGRILVSNRSPAAADRMARLCGGEVVDFASLATRLTEADVVLTSTSSDSPILTFQMVKAAQARRQGRAMLIIDIAVPRDVEPAAGRLGNVSLHNIDDLERIVKTTMRSRRDHRRAAEAIARKHVQDFLAGLNVRAVAPTIRALYRRMQSIAAEELDGARRKLSTHEDAEQDAQILQRALHRTIRRILHPCAANLRRAAGSDAARAHIAALKKLFDLEP